MNLPMDIVYLVVLKNKWKPHSRVRKYYLSPDVCTCLNIRHSSSFGACVLAAQLGRAMCSPVSQCAVSAMLQPLLYQKKCWPDSWCVRVLNSFHSLGMFPLYLRSLFKHSFFLPFSRGQLKDISYRMSRNKHCLYIVMKNCLDYRFYTNKYFSTKVVFFFFL